jgi:hypothetical protein
MRWVLGGLLMVILLTACTVAPPNNTDNLCELFREKPNWYRDAQQASKKWGSSIPVMMAMTHQESSFQQHAQPPRKTYLGFIPGPRPSDAYGYAQAKNDTWQWYQDKTGQHRAQRHRFRDAIDFIGWYNQMSHRQNGIALTDTYNLYLAYHEGHGGFKRRTFNSKPWLKNVATKVAAREARYSSQLQHCYKPHKSQPSKFFGVF